MRFSLFAALLLAAQPLALQPAAAQVADTTGPRPVLTLDEALSLARKNNPAFLQTVNGRRRAGAQLRSAWGALLPSVDADFSTQYREGRRQFVNGVPFGATSDILSSAYGISAQASFNIASLINPRLQSAALDAAEADVSGAAENLRATVTQQYLAVLQEQARAALQDSLLSLTELQLAAAQARAAAGAATTLDVRRAEVAVGQQRVAGIQARNQAEVEKLRLFQQMGVAQPADVMLTTTFEVVPPTHSLDDLLELAKRSNPALNAVRSREDVASLGYRRAQSAYTPTLSLFTSWGGQTNQLTNDEQVLSSALGGMRGGCIDDARIFAIDNNTVPDFSACPTDLTPAQREAVLSANDQFPFDFTKNPWLFQARLSVPIFDGFNREQQVQEAAANRADARYAVRAEELRLTADVTGAYRNLTTAVQTVAIQEQNSRAAREALQLTEERYRVGAASFVELTQARSDYERAETDRINAIYEYHRSYAALENAVGRSLR